MFNNSLCGLFSTYFALREKILTLNQLLNLFLKSF